MKIHTIEDDFEYQVTKILQWFISDYEDLIRDAKAEGKDLDAVLWENKKEIGEIFLERLSDYVGEAEQFVKEEWDAIQEEEDEA